jgi:hypothetical protein
VSRKPFDPIDVIPTPATARMLYAEAAARAARLKILVELSDRIHATDQQQQVDERPFHRTLPEVARA